MIVVGELPKLPGVTWKITKRPVPPEGPDPEASEYLLVLVTSQGEVSESLFRLDNESISAAALRLYYRFVDDARALLVNAGEVEVQDEETAKTAARPEAPNVTKKDNSV